jgi:hypothetical protein
MQYLVYVILLAATVSEQLSYSHLFPGKSAILVLLFPEMLSVLVVAIVIFAGTRQRFRFVRAPYLITFGAIALVITFGLIANTVAPGPITAGMRYYARAIPLFFLPAVYEFTPLQVKKQFRFLLFIGIVQLPLAIHQRMTVLEQQRWSGDSVVGTFIDSSFLSMYLIGAVCILTGMFVRKQISALHYFFLFFYLLAATTINETKGTLILLPIGLLAAAIVGSPPARRLRVVLLSSVLLVTFGSGFVVVYDYVQRFNPYFISITDFFTSEHAMEHYVDTKSGLGTRHQVGRIDAIVTPFKRLAGDPVQLAFGVGVGNASHSSLGEQYTGEYFALYDHFEITAISVFMIEIGVLGTALVFVLYFLIFNDALVVARADDTLMGPVAIGWVAITLIFIVSMPYKPLHVSVSMSYLFWYLSGMVAARRMYLANSAPQPSRTAAVTHSPARNAGAAVPSRRIAAPQRVALDRPVRK